MGKYSNMIIANICSMNIELIFENILRFIFKSIKFKSITSILIYKLDSMGVEYYEKDNRESIKRL